ncbi:RNA exonuclease 3, partial [Ceratobasidium sp. 394]
MFRPAGLFKSNQCPDQRCIRSPCPLSHGPTQTSKSATGTQPVHVSTDVSPLLGKPTPSSSNARPVSVARASTAPTRGNNNDAPGPSTSKQPALASSSLASASSSAGRPPVPARPTRPTPAPRVGAAKRPLETLSPAPSPPPPAKVPKVAPGQTSLSATGAPILNINAANTNVPLIERQKMVTVIYETFRTLYSDIPRGSETATLPGQHAIAQEAEIYARSQRRTYKINGAHTITMIKKRPKPNRISHPSVGTQGTIEARRRTEAELKNSTLKRSQVEHAVLSREQLSRWGYLVEVPDGPGGTRVSDEGQEATCERCQTLFVVRAPQSEQEAEELSLKCTYHWGRTYMSKAAGMRELLY